MNMVSKHVLNEGLCHSLDHVEYATKLKGRNLLELFSCDVMHLI